MTGPISIGIISGYLANIFADSALEAYRDWCDRTREPAPSLDVEAIDAALSAVLRGADFADYLGPDAPADDLTAFTRFLTSRDLGNLTADTVAIHIAAEGSERLSALHEQCCRLLISYGVSGNSSEIASDKLLHVINSVSIEYIHTLAHISSSQQDQDSRAIALRAEAVKRIRERQRNQIDTNLATLTTLVDKEHVDQKKIDQKLASIKESVDQIHRYLAPPGIHEVTRVPIDDLYVLPNILLDEESPNRPPDTGRPVRRESEPPAPTDLVDLLECSTRLVVVGNPGAGKTTLSQFIAQRISTGRLRPTTEQRSKSWPEVSFPIVLRELREPIFSPAGVNIIRAAQMILKARYQVELSRAEVEFLCASGRVLLILDGLDEITHRQDRIAVSNSIDGFARLYPRCRVLATSRIIGYRQAPLSKDLFTVGAIAPFAADQVTTYAQKWFDLHLHKDLTPLQRRTLTASFLAESGNIEDLRENPLLLALMCNLYRHQRYIPRNRPEIYKACSHLLFVEWDRSRRLRPAFPFEAHIDGMVKYIAAWVFTNPDALRGVQEEILVRVAADYLNEWQYRSRPEAEAAATNFLAFCHDRAWILTDVGQTQQSTRLYGFTHRTFLEYYTATHYTETKSGDQLRELVLDKAKESSWNTVCQLIVQLAAKKERGLDDKLVDALTTQLDTLAPQDRDIAFTVCSASLESVPLRPDTVTRVAAASVGYYWKSLLAAPNDIFHSFGSVVGRTTYWLDSSRISAENFQAASETVAHELGQLMLQQRQRGRYARSRYPIVVKVLAHLFDFEFGQIVRQTDFRAPYPEQLSSAVTEVLSTSTEPWVESVALASGLMIEGDASKSLAVQAFTAERISPVALPFGCRSAPSLAEIIVWWGIHAAPADQPFVEGVLLPRAVAVLNALRDPPAKFIPHPTWATSTSTDVGPRSLNATTLSPEFRDCATRIALMLVEGYVTADIETARTRTAEMSIKHWGNLKLVATAIESRYDLGGPGLTEADQRTLRDLGLPSWAEASAEHIQS